MYCFKKIGVVYGRRPLYLIKIPLIYTYIGFGVIDRGTNVLQIRPTTLCPLNCIFCSVDAGPFSRNRVAEFIIDKNSILETVREIASYKNTSIEALIDTIGEGLTYPYIFELIRELKKIPYVKTVALETHGLQLTRETIIKLWENGLDRVNLSIETFNVEKAKLLQGVPWYNPLRVKDSAEFLVKETDIDLHVTPVWLPGLNDDDLVEIVEWAYRIGAGKKWPPVTIQKFILHRFGRAPNSIKRINWKDFWKWLENFEAKTGYRVSWSMEEWGMYRAPRIKCPYSPGDIVGLEIVSTGVFKWEFLGVTLDKNIVVCVRDRVKIGGKYFVKITDTRDCLIKARVVGEV
ncbi:MAG: radical SAM protein [Desulfurococcaceae archaeon]